MSEVLRAFTSSLQLLLLSALILIPRCANHEQVFHGGNVYFTDADCYARMTRVRMCLAHPGLVVRHHDFENFPQGVTPHTTAPLDYLILALSILLAPFTSHALDLAGAIISPLLALAGGWFLWGWARQMKFRYGWPMLVLFAISPILVHGTELGRPDHQSVLIVLLTIVFCAESYLMAEPSRAWSITAGCAWGLALWVSLYEPLVLLAFFLLVSLILRDTAGSGILGKRRRAGWICFLILIALALAIERRVPSFVSLAADTFVRNWTHSIGELHPVPFLSAVWLRWAGCLVVVTPLLVWLQRTELLAEPTRRRQIVLLLSVLGVIFCLTMWQARWAYFFVSVFLITLPALLEPWRSRSVIWVIFILSLWPIAREWDEKLWPNEVQLGQRASQEVEQVNLHELALVMRSSDLHPFLAPWWLAPSIAYWSGQPAAAGSSHEGVAGIVATATFYASDDPQKAREIVETRQIDFVLSYDADRVAESCSQILGQSVSEHALCYVLDRAPANSPRFLVLAAQNPTGKLFRVGNNR